MRNTDAAPPTRSLRLEAIRKAAYDLKAKARLLKAATLDKLALRSTYERDWTGTYVFKRRRFAILGWKFDRFELQPRSRKRAMNNHSLMNLRPRSSKKAKPE